MASTEETMRSEQFVADMIRVRGIEFARLGMAVEVNGEMGIIEGMNQSGNLDVRFTSENKHSGLHNCHPTWQTKYFDQEGNLIAHFDDDKCLLRPKRPSPDMVGGQDS